MRNSFDKIQKHYIAGRSCYRPLTVKQFDFVVSAKSTKFWKKSLNGHATVVGDHATVGGLSNNFFWRINQNGKISKKVTEWPRDSRLTVTLTVKQFFRCFSKNDNIWKKIALFIRLTRIAKFRKNIADRWSEVTRSSADRRVTSDECRLTVQGLFSKCCNFCWNVEWNIDSYSTVAGGLIFPCFCLTNSAYPSSRKSLSLLLVLFD